MARNQKNFNLFTYVDNNGLSWNIRGEDGGAAAAVDGHAAFGATQPRWIVSAKHRPRKIVYQDPVTFRTVEPIFYTSAAWAAVAIGDILAVTVAGLATTVNYSAIEKVGERQPRVSAARQLADV